MMDPAGERDLRDAKSVSREQRKGGNREEKVKKEVRDDRLRSQSESSGLTTYLVKASGELELTERLE